VNKNLQEIRIKPIVQSRQHWSRRNIPEADQSNAPWWTFSFISV